MPKESKARLRITGDGVGPWDYKFSLNGTEIGAGITGISLDMRVDEINRAYITYVCERIEVDGEFKIVHQCPQESE